METIGYFHCKSTKKLKELWEKGSKWMIGTDGGLKDGLGTCGVAMFEQGKTEPICTSMSAESCPMNLLHSTREEIKANLAREIIINECSLHFTTRSTNKIKYICDSRSALAKLDNTSSKYKEPGLI